MSIHLVLYSNNEPFVTTKRLLIESVTKFTKRKIIIHDYDLEKIKGLDWFKYIEYFPSIDTKAKRDGYYNSWKPFIVRDVYMSMNTGDILYYVDCSQYYRTGFTESIDKLCDIAEEKKCIAGSIGNNVKNNTNSCCDELLVWNKILPSNDNTKYLDKLHVLNSWFLFLKCESNDAFVNEWVYFCCYKDDETRFPLIIYHHTVDQSIFNILAYKYKLTVFHTDTINHDENKDRNLVLKVVNTTENPDAFFISLS